MSRKSRLSTRSTRYLAIVAPVALVGLIAVALLLGGESLRPAQAAHPATTVFVDATFVGVEDGSALFPFDTIQEGVDHAIAGDTVEVAAGTYAELVTIGLGKDNLTVSGIGTPLVDATGLRNGFVVKDGVDGVTVDGFEIIGDADTNAGIVVNPGSDNAILTSNVIHGMHLPNLPTSPASYGILVWGNDAGGPDLLAGNWAGACLGQASPSGTLISGNEIYDTNLLGISLGDCTTGTTIEDNNVHDVDPVDIGIVISIGIQGSTSDNVDISGNTLTNLIVGTNLGPFSSGSVSGGPFTDVGLKLAHLAGASITVTNHEAYAKTDFISFSLNTTGYFSTVQDAVVSATAGGTVDVSAGTFTTGAQVVIDKDLTIAGATAATTIIKPGFDTGSKNNDTRGWFLVNSGIVFHLSDVTMDGTGNKVWQAIRHKGEGTITDVIFTEIKFEESGGGDPGSGAAYSGLAMAAFGTGPVDVTGSTFTEIGRVGVLYFFPTVNGSIYSQNSYTGKGDGDHLDYAVEAGGGADIEITNNTILDNRGVASSDSSTSAGILVTTFFGAGSGATITGNTISDSTTGIAVGFCKDLDDPSTNCTGPDTSTVTAFSNSFVGNGTGVSSTAPAVDASGNWWGSADAATVKAQADDGTLVDYSPWLDTDADTSGDPGFQGDFSVLHVDDDSPQSDATGHIQEGVNLVSGSTVLVEAGTYEEQVEIDKPLTLTGAGKGLTVLESPDTLTAFFTTSQDNYPIVFVRDTDNVTVEELTVDGLGKGNANFRFVGIGYSNASGTIDTVNITGVRNTPISGSQHGVGILANADSGTARSLAITDSVIDDYQKNAMALSGVDLTVAVTGNTTTGAGAVDFIAQNGIQVGFGAGGSITGNDTSDHYYTPFTFSATGILLFNASPGVEVSGNNIHDNMEGLFIQGSDDVVVAGNTVIDTIDTGVFVFDSQNATLDGNTVTSNDIGILPFFSDGGTYEDNIVTSNSYGILPIASDGGTYEANTLTSNGIGLYLSDASANSVTGNTIDANDHGIFIEGDSVGTDILGNDITNNTGSSSGIHVEPFDGFSPSDIEVHFNDIVGNGGAGGFGVFNDTANVIDATNNWWGACDGPSGVASGSGDPVSANVDYDPWTDGKCDPDNDFLTTDEETLIYGTDPNDPDTDKDGCLDGVEVLPDAAVAVGGGRDPLYHWDFVDQWIGGSRDKAIVIGDIGAVVARFGTAGDAPNKLVDFVEAITPPGDTTSYHPSADRGGVAGPNAWNLLPPNGSITVGDIGTVVAQFGYSCA